MLGKHTVYLFPGYDLEKRVDSMGEGLRGLGRKVQESGDGEMGEERVAYEIEGVSGEVIERVRGESGVEWVGYVNEGTVEQWGKMVKGEWDIDREGLLIWRKDEAPTDQDESYLAQIRCTKPGYLMKHIKGAYAVDLWPGISLDEHIAFVKDVGLKPKQVELRSQQALKWTTEHVAYSADDISDELLLAIRNTRT